MSSLKLPPHPQRTQNTYACLRVATAGRGGEEGSWATKGIDTAADVGTNLGNHGTGAVGEGSMG